jgi:sugar/nucleoside kinase (ribokinase family)
VLPRVLVIGDVMTDVIVRSAGAISIGADTPATIHELPGGSGANQAAWLAVEGVPVRLAGRVGKRDHAEQTALLAKRGVDARLGCDDALPTGRIVSLISPEGERSFLTDAGANEALSRDDLPATMLDGVDLVEMSGYVLFRPGPRAAALELLAEARRRGIPFAVDPSSWSFLKETGAERFLAWTEGASICFPNRAEAAALSGSEDVAEQLGILCRSYPLVVIKGGTEAAFAAEAESGRQWSAPVPDVEAVDASGGGDAFFAGFIGAYLRGEGIDAALRRGVSLGARAAATLGGRPETDLAPQIGVG